MNHAQNRILMALARAGSWLGRTELAAKLDYSEQRVDDELADLVISGAALFNARGNEYRLGGTSLARQALKRLIGSKYQRTFLGRPDTAAGVLRIGMAVRVRAASQRETLVMAEVEVPMPDRSPDGIQQIVSGLAAWDTALAKAEGAPLPVPTHVSAGATA